jgi:hypothetical protein
MTCSVFHQVVLKSINLIINKNCKITLFSSPGPKVHLNYCHHLASVVCQLFTFQASSPKPLLPIGTKLSRNVPWIVVYKVSVFRSSRIFNMAARANNMLKFQRSSSLKLMNWLNPNYKWMIIGMSFTKFLTFMPTGNPRWPPSQDIY